MWRQSPLRYRGRLETSASAIAFASASGTRWTLTDFSVAWSNVSTLATLMFVEGATTTVSTIFFQFGVSTSSGFFSARHGEVGIQASDAGSSFRFLSGSSEAGSFTVAFAGYQSGG